MCRLRCVSLARACYESSLGSVENIFSRWTKLEPSLEFESVARRTLRSRVFFAFLWKYSRCHLDLEIRGNSLQEDR